jgi:CheY-like chemotaxis protein
MAPTAAPAIATAAPQAPTRSAPAPAPEREAKKAAPRQGRRLSDGASDDALTGMTILIVDDDFRNIFALSALLERGHAEVLTAESGSDALATLARVPTVDIVLMDIMMPGMDGYETMRAIRAIEQFETIPIIAVTGKVMAGERQRCLDAGANEYVPKPIDSSELLAALQPWIHTEAKGTEARVSAVPGVSVSGSAESGSPVADSETQDATAPRPEADPVPTTASYDTSGPKVLVVDDDFRNTFALAALLERGHVVIVADSGSQALVELEQHPDIDVVLMDIMMPVMDGYDTMRAIRAFEHFKSLPIIAVTGKVMPGERQRCIEAGATDYVPKPVDSAELFAALRPWLPNVIHPTSA